MNFVTGKAPLNKFKLQDLLQKSSHPLQTAADLDPLMDLIGDAKYVLLGEASHGTHEYYTWRTHITKRLIAEKNFSFIAVEGDWPDCYKVNRYIKGYTEAGPDARSVLHEFTRWPTWMWANWEIVALAEWLHKYNAKHLLNKRIGFYGLDLYSLWESMDAMVEYLKETDPLMLKEAMKVVQCFEPYGRDEGSSYASATLAFSYSCENEVVNLLTKIRQSLPRYDHDHEAVFSAGQNALVIAHAEEYYRAMMRGGAITWNLRDRHMVETLDGLMKFHGDDAKVIVWEHNTHIGDARATDMKRNGMVNVGQLVHEAHHRDGVVRVGFGSYKGSVIAGREWGEPMKSMPVPPAQEGSFEDLLHTQVKRNCLLLTRDLEHINFSHPIGHRAIGVVYNPEVERYGNYVPSVIPLRYEAFIYLDETRALHPLHIAAHGHEVPDTYPWGV